MDSITLIFIWLGVVTLLGLIMGLSSAYFAWWFLSVRNPKITELLVNAYHQQQEENLNRRKDDN